jgi:signal transduction histidine kinase
VIRSFTPVAATALAAVTLAAAPRTSYIGVSPFAAAAFAVAIIALGAAASLSASPAATALAAASAFTLTLPIWAASPTLGPAARSLADAIAPLAVPLILALAIVAAGVPARGLLTALAVEGAIVGATRILLRDPFYDTHCFADCVASPLVLARATGMVRALEAIDGPARVLLALAVALRLRGRARDAIGPGLLAVALAVRTIMLAIDPQEAATRPALMLAYCLTATGAATVGLVIAADAATAFLGRRAALRLLTDLRVGANRSQIEAALRIAARDPQLALLDGTPAAGRAVLPVIVAGQEIARIAHQPGARRPLERALGPSMRLALANALLREQLEARITQLRASRERVVNLSDATRRSLERDLHDGAQQGVLAVLFELRLEAGLAADPARRAALERAAGETADVLEELRTLAHGIHPAILTDAGLRAALHALAAATSVRVDVSGAPERRYPAAVEATVYRLVEEVVRDASEHVETHAVLVGFAERPGTLVVTLPASLGDLEALTDRIELCDGAMAVDGTVVTIEIPCG